MTRLGARSAAILATVRDAGPDGVQAVDVAQQHGRGAYVYLLRLTRSGRLLRPQPGRYVHPDPGVVPTPSRVSGARTPVKVRGPDEREPGRDALTDWHSAARWVAEQAAQLHAIRLATPGSKWDTLIRLRFDHDHDHDHAHGW